VALNGSTRSHSRHVRRAPTIERARVDEQIGEANDRAFQETLSAELNVMIDVVLTLIIPGRVITVNRNVHSVQYFCLIGRMNLLNRG
jgi:hypothetical protein